MRDPTPKQRAIAAKQMQIVLGRLVVMGKTTKDMAIAIRDKLTPQRLTNWKTRGIPAAMLLKVAAFIGADPEELGGGNFVPRGPKAAPEAPEFNQEADDLYTAYRVLDKAEQTAVWKIMRAKWRVLAPGYEDVMPDLTPDKAAQINRILQRTKDESKDR